MTPQGDQPPCPEGRGPGLAALAATAPPLPTTLVEFVALAEHPDALRLDEVTRLVEQDPIVVARLMKIVNSAYYGLKRSVGSARRAVELLGPVTVGGIVLGMGITGTRIALGGRAAGCFTRLTRHAIATAHVARRIASTLERAPTPETAFTAGLVHDFGQMLFLHEAPDQALAIYDREDLLSGGDDLLELEQLAFGYDHTEAGEYVSLSLDFPDPLVHVIRYHHEPGDSAIPESSRSLVRMVAAADVAAGGLGFGFWKSDTREECESHPVWTHLAPPDLRGLLDLIWSMEDDLTRQVDAATLPFAA